MSYVSSDDVMKIMFGGKTDLFQRVKDDDLKHRFKLYFDTFNGNSEAPFVFLRKEDIKEILQTMNHHHDINDDRHDELIAKLDDNVADYLFIRFAK